ncbi:Rho-like small GTPase [Rasamsonia emersonii CBS 393.64]|uniref:Rho-like small GTPase n=1 Tax=Rasamsonia emersonii (strain ATCC 16479 / CBS 393.64 / IMI 116815) TaxID=1408163 RepID=A0A0F4Z0H9_RASE3|nr:Rho-like small GTPase [Rasamsonia emersonii CBS 393.64]KKA23596.1 Rho-like small GTPase [Rasamsonia emersonii CBS 393.64]
MDETGEKATVTILLLGDPGCGKSTFLSRLKTLKPSPPSQAKGEPKEPLQLLHDSNQPFVYDIRFSKKSFRLEFYDTASPNQHWTTLQPDVVLLAFDISNRATLDGLKGFLSQSAEHEKKKSTFSGAMISPDISKVEQANSYRIAQELHCDCYAECSAVTGELMAETFEDIAKTAAMTTTASGGQSAGGCTIL